MIVIKIQMKHNVNNSKFQRINLDTFDEVEHSC